MYICFNLSQVFTKRTFELMREVVNALINSEKSV